MIYVDEIQPARPGQAKPKACRYARRWCRLLSDSGEIEELHAFAAALGLKSSWFQPHPILPFYVLTPPKRAAALLQGAQEMPLEMLEAAAEQVKLVAFGVDTLVLNVRYADEQFHATNMISLVSISSSRCRKCTSVLMWSGGISRQNHTEVAQDVVL